MSITAKRLKELTAEAVVTDSTRYLNPHQCAAYLGKTYRALENMRRVGKGPTYIRVEGRIMYDRRAVEAWLARAGR